MMLPGSAVPRCYWNQNVFWGFLFISEMRRMIGIEKAFAGVLIHMRSYMRILRVKDRGYGKNEVSSGG